MMGMSAFVYWFSWFFKGFVYLIITLSIVVIIFQAGPKKIFDFSDSSLLYFFLLSYAVSVVAFSFLLSSFFNKGKKKTNKRACFFGHVILCSPYITRHVRIFLSVRFVIVHLAVRLSLCKTYTVSSSLKNQLLNFNQILSWRRYVFVPIEVENNKIYWWLLKSSWAQIQIKLATFSKYL